MTSPRVYTMAELLAAVRERDELRAQVAELTAQLAEARQCVEDVACGTAPSDQI
jgi:hypothetical protein